MMTLVGGNSDTDFVYRHNFDGNAFEFSTIEVKKILGDVAIDSPEILSWINGYIQEGLEEINRREFI